LHPALKQLGQPKAGFHAFRRFRTTWLRKNRAPEDLIRFWLGHADQTVTDGYSKLREDVEYRREVAEKIGLGFEISAQTPDVVPNVPSLELAVAVQNAA
jgi:integrase